jgi:hypothetical protein
MEVRRKNEFRLARPPFFRDVVNPAHQVINRIDFQVSRSAGSFLPYPLQTRFMHLVKRGWQPGVKLCCCMDMDVRVCMFDEGMRLEAIPWVLVGNIMHVKSVSVEFQTELAKYICCIGKAEWAVECKGHCVRVFAIVAPIDHCALQPAMLGRGGLLPVVMDG